MQKCKLKKWILKTTYLVKFKEPKVLKVDRSCNPLKDFSLVLLIVPEVIMVVRLDLQKMQEFNVQFLILNKYNALFVISSAAMLTCEELLMPNANTK